MSAYALDRTFRASARLYPLVLALVAAGPRLANAESATSARKSETPQDSADASHSSQPAALPAIPDNPLPPPELSPQPAYQLVVGAGAGVVHRPATGERVKYLPGPLLGGFGNIVLLDWLGIKLGAGLEYHTAELSDDALGLNEYGSDVALRGLRMSVELVPRLSLNQQLDGWLAVGAGWARFEADALQLETMDATDVFLSDKAGVMIEYPASLGLTWLASGRIGVSLSASFILSTAQTGELFEAEHGNRQALRQDTGSIVNVSGFPEFNHALQTQLTIDLFL